MSHIWEHEDEYLKIKSAFRRAEASGDTAECERLRPRIEYLDSLMWRSKTERFAELVPYQTVVGALQATARRLELAFPDLTDPRNNAGDGQFIFGISDGQRTVEVWPMEDRGYYNIQLFDYTTNASGDCYKGRTQSLEEATIVVSRWFVERCSINLLHEQFSWIGNTPFVMKGPRMTFG